MFEKLVALVLTGEKCWFLVGRDGVVRVHGVQSRVGETVEALKGQNGGVAQRWRGEQVLLAFVQVLEEPMSVPAVGRQTLGRSVGALHKLLVIR